MNELLTVLQSNIIEILMTLLVALAGYLGTVIKNIYEEKVTDETKRKVVKTVVNAIEKVYEDLDGNEKLIKAEETIIEMLTSKGIVITDLELRMLIEEVCNSFKKNISE